MESSIDSNVQKVDLPNASAVLVLGIISIVGCCCSNGILGLICSIIALVMARSANNLYIANPGMYTESSYKNMNAGKICAWISLIISILLLIFLIFMISAIGIAGLTDPNVLYDYFGIDMP